jgi:AraC-like DNA-binding protein
MNFDKNLVLQYEECLPMIDYLVFRRCPPTWRLKEHFVENCDITYLVKGSAQYTINGKTYEVSGSEGDLVCVSEDDVKAATTDPQNPMECFSVNFVMKNSKGETMRLPFPPVSRIGKNKDIIYLFHELIFTWTDKQQGYTIKARGLLWLILHHLFELTIYNTDTSDDDWRIKKVTRYISKHYADRISVRKMADMTGLTTVYFGALFKRTTGLTMNQYLMKIRISNAKSMLQTGEYRVNEVAEYCGFANIAHFFKHFKAIMGEAPSSCIPGRSIRF